METIHIAVICTAPGFKKFQRDMRLPAYVHGGNEVKFIAVNNGRDIQGNYFNSYIIHYSAWIDMNSQLLDELIILVERRLRSIK